MALTGGINLLLGSNGSGKSTIINLLAGLTYPNKGILRLDGSEYDSGNREAWRSGTETLRKRSRFWLDKPGLPLPLTGRELLKFEWHKEDDHSFASLESLANSFGISVDLDRPISGYSSGMQQKLGIIATLLGRPRFVVWDEPTAALDATSRATVARLAKDYASQGTKFLIASHIPGDFEGVADWIGLMRLGRLLKAGNIPLLSKSESNDCVIHTDRPSQLAGRLVELGMATSVSVEKGNGYGDITVKTTEEFDEAKVARLSREEFGATQFSVSRRQKSITELYMEALA
jgi:ABC-2 type transport system ATP-binding protein